MPKKAQRNPMLHTVVDRFAENFDKAYQLISDLSSDACFIHDQMHLRASRTLMTNFDKIEDGFAELEERVRKVRSEMPKVYGARMIKKRGKRKKRR